MISRFFFKFQAQHRKVYQIIVSVLNRFVTLQSMVCMILWMDACMHEFNENITLIGVTSLQSNLPRNHLKPSLGSVSSGNALLLALLMAILYTLQNG